MRFLKAFFLHSTDRISPALPAFVSLWAILFLAGLTVRSVLSPALFVLLYLFYARTGRAQIRVWYLLLSLFFGISALLVEGPRISSAFSSGLFRAAALLIMVLTMYTAT